MTWNTGPVDAADRWCVPSERIRSRSTGHDRERGRGPPLAITNPTSEHFLRGRRRCRGDRVRDGGCSTIFTADPGEVSVARRRANPSIARDLPKLDTGNPLSSPSSDADPLAADRSHELARALLGIRGSDAPLDAADLALATELADRARSAQSSLGSSAPLKEFFDHIASRIAADGPANPAHEQLLQLCVEDLYLAFACAAGEPRALRAFEQLVGRELDIALARLRVPASRHEDVRQELYQKLFTGDHPRILEYSGRGRLRYWFGVMAMRALIDDRRRQRPDDAQRAEQPDADLMAPAADPEIEHLKRLYSHEFKTAFEQAIFALSPEARNVLRSYYRFEMTVDQIASAYGIHRATAARRVQRAREELLADTRRILAERLQLQSDELKSILKLIESRLHVSLHRLLD